MQPDIYHFSAGSLQTRNKDLEYPLLKGLGYTHFLGYLAERSMLVINFIL